MQTARQIKLTAVLAWIVLTLFVLLKTIQNQLNVIKESSLHPYDQEFHVKPKTLNVVERTGNDSLPDLNNFPWSFYKQKFNKAVGMSKNCENYPSISNLRFHNVHWQKSIFNGIEFYLFGAYYDARPRQSPVIRILIMVNTLDLNVPTKCQLWYRDKDVLTNFTWATYIWKKSQGSNHLYQPYLLSCAIPKEVQNEIPISVSLIGENVCNTASNNLYINYNVGEHTKFGVCVKGLILNDDISTKLIEWIELINLLGASKIYFYTYDTDEDTSRLLDYYEHKNTVEFTKTSLPGGYPNIKHLQQAYLRKYPEIKTLVEVVQYNDCFYKNLYKHEFMVILDIDEILEPKEGNWNDVLVSMKSNASYYYKKGMYFFKNGNEKFVEDVPIYLPILKSLRRTEKISNSGSCTRSFFNTRDVLVVHKHVPLHCMNRNGECTNLEMGSDLIQLNCYGKFCSEDVRDKVKKNFVTDTNVLRFKEEVIGKVNTTLKELGLLDV